MPVRLERVNLAKERLAQYGAHRGSRSGHDPKRGPPSAFHDADGDRGPGIEIAGALSKRGRGEVEQTNASSDGRDRPLLF